MRLAQHGKLVYVTSVDISIDNGPGVNERGFVNELIKTHTEQAICIIPYPCRNAVHNYMSVLYLISHRRYNPLFYLLYNFHLFFKLRRLCRKERIDSIIFRLDVFPLGPLLVAHFMKVPVIIKTLTGHISFADSKSRKQKIVAMLSAPLYSLICKKAISIDTPSAAYIAWLEERYHIPVKRIRVIPNGADVLFFTPGGRQKARLDLGLDRFKYIVGYVGTLASVRNVDLLIQALAKVRNIEKLGLVLVGKGRDFQVLEGMAEKLGITKNVVFTGQVPNWDVPKYLKAFDVGVDLTYIPIAAEGKVKNASYSQKIAQYLSSGLPVIAYDVPDNAFLEQQSIGKLVAINDIDGLARSMEVLMSLEPHEKKRMEHKSREYAKRVLSVSKITQKRVEMWREALG